MSSQRDNKWTREEHILAFNLYCQIPFGTMHSGNPRVKELAKMLGRSDGSVAYKLSNFARLDPALQERGISGLQHGAKGEEDVWREFSEHPETLAYESEFLLAARMHKPVEEVAGIEVKDLPPEGIEREAIVRVRVNQNFFRRRIISAFEFRCCVTGLAVRELLVASHIVPWAKDPANRLNPKNGLCLNALHDRAFDRRLMWVDEAFTIRFSRALRAKEKKQDQTLNWLTSFEGQKLCLPKRFAPDPGLLKRHAEACAS
jgi:putative restriction endonuclease